MTTPDLPTSADGPAPAAESPSPTTAAIPSEDLLKGTREVLIRHAGELYRLRLTRNGKLILMK